MTAPTLARPADTADHLHPLNEVTEVAAYLRCGRTHVFALIKSGALGSVKVGRKRLIPADAVHTYLRETAVAP